MKTRKEYVSIPFRGIELETDKILEACEHIMKQFPSHKVYFNPVCAFGISYSGYIDDEAQREGRDWEMKNPCGMIIYSNEDNVETRLRVSRRIDEFTQLKIS